MRTKDACRLRKIQLESGGECQIATGVVGHDEVTKRENGNKFAVVKVTKIDN